MIPEENTTIDFIRNPELLNRNTIPVLQEAIRQYPYHQSLYLLLLQNMYKVHDPHFSSALKQYALMVADRSVLFEMVEGMNYNIPVQKLEEETVVADGDRTLRLIDNFLKSIPEAQSGRSERQDAADPQIDYPAYLEQLPDFEEDADVPLAEIAEKGKTSESNKTREPGDSGETVEPIPSDEEFTVSAIRRDLAEADDLPPAEECDEEEQNSDFYTEAMAGIYIKQQKFEQALEIIRAISADNPKKSVYFAEQIRYLELLMRLNRNKK
ncbi:MAG: hypothetical protein Q4E49_04660 [Bacteroidales bacterium]|nr:hypothetical protein [Bacteroidales bacterium]